MPHVARVVRVLAVRRLSASNLGCILLMDQCVQDMLIRNYMDGLVPIRVIPFSVWWI
jgi:hypothetical protein